jgi:hypothetical protein
MLINPRGMPPSRIAIDNDPEGSDPMWVAHPDPDVDVAVTGMLHGHFKQLGYVERLVPLHSTQAFTLDRLQELNVTEGDPVAVVGFPMELVTLPRSRPIMRTGCIARISDLYDQGGSIMLLDVHVFPGNSGGPAFLMPQVISVTDQPPCDEGGLLGIVSAYVPYRDVAISPQTGRPRVVFEENSGLTIVHTVDSIHEAIDAFEAVYPLKQS